MNCDRSDNGDNRYLIFCYQLVTLPICNTLYFIGKQSCTGILSHIALANKISLK